MPRCWQSRQSSDEPVFLMVSCFSQMHRDRSLVDLSLGLLGRRLLISDSRTSYSLLQMTSSGSRDFSQLVRCAYFRAAGLFITPRTAQNLNIVIKSSNGKIIRKRSEIWLKYFSVHIRWYIWRCIVKISHNYFFLHFHTSADWKKAIT